MLAISELLEVFYAKEDIFLKWFISVFIVILLPRDVGKVGYEYASLGREFPFQLNTTESVPSPRHKSSFPSGYLRFVIRVIFLLSLSKWGIKRIYLWALMRPYMENIYRVSIEQYAGDTFGTLRPLRPGNLWKKWSAPWNRCTLSAL